MLFINPIVNPIADLLPVNGMPKLVITNNEAAAAAWLLSSPPPSIIPGVCIIIHLKVL
jgi:hypothetical protein